MSGLKNVLFSLLLAGASLTAGFYLYQWLNPPPPPKPPKITQVLPKPRPSFALPDTKGKLRHVEEWQGKVLVINFWATWCGPCREEIPTFIQLQKQYGDQGLQFLGIAIDRLAPVQKFYREIGMNYPSLVAESKAMKVGRQYGNARGVLPFTAIINRQNQIVSLHQGTLPADQLVPLIQALL